MNSLKFIIDNYNVNKEFSLLGKTFIVSSGRNVLAHLRSKYLILADEMYNSYLATDNGYKNLEELVENARSTFESLIMNKITEVVNDAISVGIFTLDASLVFKECKTSYFNCFYDAYNAFAKPFNATNATLEKHKEARQKSSQYAMGYAVRNNVSANDIISENIGENIAEKAEAKKKFKELFKNQQLRNKLKNSVRSCCFNLYAYIVDQFPKKSNIVFSGNVTNNDVKNANAIFNNISNPALSEEQKIEFVHKILESNPYGDDYYVTFAKLFPDNTVEFIKIADFFGAPSIISKVNNDLIAYVNENIGETEADVDYCKSLLLQKLSEVGLSKESAAPVYAVIQERSNQLDLEYRTVEGAVFETRDEADAARASFAENENVLKKDCADFIMRSDYTDHIDNIKMLSVPQSIIAVYVMRYEQRLSEFDKKCKAAALYEEANSSEKRSLKNRLASIGQSSDTQKSAWEEVTHNGQYSLSDIMSGMPDEKGIMNTVGDIGNTAVDKAKAAAGKLKGLFGKK